MFSSHYMERQKRTRYNFLGNNSRKPRRFNEAFEPYRKAFILGDLQQQNFIINEFVSSLVSAESARLTEERGCSVEEVQTLPLEEIFTCNLCQELFHIPVTLVCGHTFCLECLENYQCQGKTVCPDCSQESSLCYTSNIVVRELSRMWFPEKTDIRNCIAETNKLLREGKMKEFMQLTKNLLQKYPENVDLLYLHAIGNKYIKNYSDALKDLDFACSLAPFCSKVLYARGELLANLDEPEEAMIMFLRASALKPNDPAYRSSLTSYLEILLRNICNSSIPSSNYDTDHDSTIKRGLKTLSRKPESTINESATTARNSSSRKQVCTVESQIEHRNRTNVRSYTAVDHKPAACSTNLTVNPDEDNACYKMDEADNITQVQRVSCIQRNIMVPQKSNIPSELECKLCFNLIYEPITTPCGHSLCQSCLRRCLDHRFDCPCCRTNLQSYMKQLMMGNIGTCEVLERLLLLRFKDDYQARKISYEKELLEFSSCDNNKDEIPIFVCTLAVPGIVCPLHIFEPPYKLMLRRCIESGSRQFGMCVPDPEHGFAAVGTMLYINDVNFMPDGRSIVHTVGIKRFKVLERGLRDGYNTAKVAWIEDECDEMDCELNYDVYNMMTQWFDKLPNEHKTCIEQAVGQMPHAHQITNKNGPVWLWWLLVAMPLNLEAKRIILSMTSVTERLNSAKRFLAILLSRL